MPNETEVKPIVENKIEAAPVGEVKPSETKIEAAPDQKVEAKPSSEKKSDEKLSDDKTPVTDFSQFTDILGEESPVVKKEEKKEEFKVIEKKEEVTDDKRDLNGIDEADIPYFKRMSNEAFARLKPLYVNHKAQTEELKTHKEKVAAQTTELENLRKGKVVLPDSYLEHPAAVMLTPEYAHNLQNVQLASSVVNHWTKQLQNVRAGDSTIKMLVNDPETGELKIGGDVKVTPETEAQLMSYITGSQHQLIQQQSGLRALVQGHQDKVKVTHDWIKDYEAKTFPVFDKEEGKQYLDFVKDAIKNFPPAFQKNPLMSLVAKSLVTNIQLGTALQKLKAEYDKLKGGLSDSKVGAENKDIVSEEQRRAGPTNASGATGSSGKANGENVTFKMFEDVIEGVRN